MTSSPASSAPAAGTPATSSPAASADRRVIVLPLEPGLVCLRGLSPKRLRFEVEYGLERGTSANAFLFEGGTSASGQCGRFAVSDSAADA